MSADSLHAPNRLAAFNPERYARQIALPEMGLEGQAKIQQARVLLVGAGGLGSPAALYLAAAGVGTLGLIDPDTVSLSNLQRQILYSSAETGLLKTEVAQTRLAALNPEVQIQSYSTALNPDNALEILADYDIIVDGSDNLSTRYLLNDACVLLKKPLVYGSVYRFEGQVASFLPGQGCYRCLFPEMPPPGSMPSCSEAGVLGVLPGLIGTLQATEVLRLITGWGEGLSAKLLLADLKTMDFTPLKLMKNPTCPSCGDNRSQQILNPENYPEIPCEILELTPAQAEQKRLSEKLTVLDVRTEAEHQLGHLSGFYQSIHLPLDQLLDGLNHLNPDTSLLVYCQKGQRSVQALRLLQAHGFNRVWSLRGGYEAYLDYQSRK